MKLNVGCGTDYREGFINIDGSSELPKVDKVVFVVDRKDLDFQTTKEFNSFSDGSVDGTDNTKALVKQFGDDTKPSSRSAAIRSVSPFNRDPKFCRMPI